MRFRSDIVGNALQVFVGKRTNGYFLGLAYPGDLQFHADFRDFFLFCVRPLPCATLRDDAAFLAASDFFATFFLAAGCVLAAGLLARSAGLSLRADFQSRSRS